ncbi:hypothetical protein [Herbaspirillum rubrisubalbicans]|uniref:hypothetical protein n=1 Tax=Herbaspirillum rubrisubalbicans TaxID=80842 RepID=UPI0012E361AD|nr:hypothetical protein [Herbaspirillum rubrisubalbicans]
MQKISDQTFRARRWDPKSPGTYPHQVLQDAITTIPQGHALYRICFYSSFERAQKSLTDDFVYLGVSHILRSTKYKILTAPRPQDGDNDRLELTVLDEHGEMLARRHYSVNWQAGISFHEPLQYEKDAVMAVNAFGEDIRIQIPPSRFDWLRARIPLLD